MDTKCDYCGLPADGKNRHPICAEEVSEALFFTDPGEQLSSCPDGDPACEACSPDYAESVG